MGPPPLSAIIPELLNCDQKCQGYPGCIVDHPLRGAASLATVIISVRFFFSSLLLRCHFRAIFIVLVAVSGIESFLKRGSSTCSRKTEGIRATSDHLIAWKQSFQNFDQASTAGAKNDGGFDVGIFQFKVFNIYDSR